MRSGSGASIAKINTRMKKETKIQMNRLAKVLLLVALGVTSVFLLSSSERYKKDRLTQDLVVDIQDKSERSFIQAKDIENQLDRNFAPKVCDRKIGQQDIAAMEALLENDPFIKSAEVYTDAKDVVHVELDQREPIIRVIDEFNKSYYLDQWGEHIPLSPQYTARTLLCTGYVSRFLEQEEYRSKLLYLIEKLKADAFLNALVEQINISPSQQVSLMPKMGCDYIELGQLKDLTPKLDRLKIFYKEAISVCGWNTYKSLNVKFKNQIVCTRK